MKYILPILCLFALFGLSPARTKGYGAGDHSARQSNAGEL